MTDDDNDRYKGTIWLMVIMMMIVVVVVVVVMIMIRVSGWQGNRGGRVK